ncbi:cation diffusion facilitator family transporter [Brooklawnia sp.]|uniref:cation diffusion facilitator family transporter n=1 Tax=Brooklawnia sp. TaxID=2699740 RepID=UPI003C783BB3
MGSVTPRKTTIQPPRYGPPVDLSRYAWLSVAAALVTIALKGGAAWLTGSVGLLSDAAESLVNLAAAIVALVALKVAIKPPDLNHPYGHSKAEYFSAALEGVMIFVAAGFIIVASIERLINPRMPEQLGFGLAIAVVASLINGTVSAVLLRQGRRYNSATLIADARHLMTDVITSVAVLVGVGLVAITNTPILDPIVALLAGSNILWTGISLIRSSVDGLMDVSLPERTNADLYEVLDRFRVPGRIEFHAVRTREAGNRQFMEFHILVPGQWSVRKGHDLTEDVIDALVEVVPEVRVSAHLEPIEDPRSYADEEDF